MLVLSRKVGERILVPDVNVMLTVVSVKGSQVRLGVSAPADVAVYREEVWRQIGDEMLKLPANRVRTRSYKGEILRER